ncbi:inositol monophosphatase [Oleiphilus sp. HI0009]|nr:MULTISPECIES: inositol monophosphatase family protein [unclassified Oleiphilus]KZX72620.1 inositol monophosphatase [Oleiphilus sp. HI0009]KZX75722.1 inositol monophosphatase [Oleiphilus sp. HI0009]KZY65740.1 inositol monophosphatase [Oleiphilus sp. HI0066]KZY76038.1 inositol monophosphatase [Oleiphilus sp. HI0067]
MSDLYQSAFQLSKKVALEAGQLIKQLREEGSLDHQYKDQHELVTNADLAADKLIVERIKEVFPDHRFLTEETCTDKSLGHDLSSPIWIIDPIDGTVNYAHGQQMVAVSIAFACDGDVQCGVVYNPFLDEMFCGLKGAGATLNEEAISISGQQNFRKAVFATGFPYDKSTLPPILERVTIMLEKCQDLRRLGSAALDICWVACGRHDFYFESLSPWDFAAARVIAIEAGARCGHFSEVPAHIPAAIYDQNLLISSPALFDQARALLAPTT